jgi:hypothetical protein
MSWNHVTGESAKPGQRKLRLAAMVATLAACHHAPTLLLTGVPEVSGRLSYDLPADSTALRAALATALAGTVCLVRSGRADECREAPDAPSCDRRSAAEVRARYAAVFDSIPRVVLSSPFEMNDKLRPLFPGATFGIPLQDARRTTPCTDWNPTDGSCAAMIYQEVWLRFGSRSDAGGRPATLEVFLANPPCRGEAR